MNLFCGTLLVEGNISLPASKKRYCVVKNIAQGNNSLLYFYGETEEKTSKQLVKSLEKEYGKVLNSDLALESEDKLVIFEDEAVDGEYSSITFTGKNTDIEDIIEDFEENEAVISIRECEKDSIF